MSYGRRTADKLITSQLNMNLPHLHARYAEFEASVNLSDGEVLAGTLPRKQLRLVQAWIELHRDELMADWELARSRELPYKPSPINRSWTHPSLRLCVLWPRTGQRDERLGIRAEPPC